jgi:serine incorporator 1/3
MENPTNVTDDFNSRMKSLWKLNVVLVLISCWVAASLTGWGMINGGVDEGGEHTAANPLVGKFNMGMIAISQNLAVLLYIWTLLAPRLFPDRVFS